MVVSHAKTQIPSTCKHPKHSQSSTAVFDDDSHCIAALVCQSRVAKVLVAHSTKEALVKLEKPVGVQRNVQTICESRKN